MTKSKTVTRGQVASVVSDPVRPHRQQPTRLLRPWDSPGKNTGMGYCSLLQGDLPDPGIKPVPPTLWADSLPSEPPGNYRTFYLKVAEYTFFSRAYIKFSKKNTCCCCCCCCCCCYVALVVSDSVRPHRRQPTRRPVPGILQARILEWVAISSSNAWKWKVKVKSLSRVRLLVTPRTAAHQAPPSMGFSRQEYWSGVPLPSLRRIHISSQNISKNSRILK